MRVRRPHPIRQPGHPDLRDGAGDSQPLPRAGQSLPSPAPSSTRRRMVAAVRHLASAPVPLDESYSTIGIDTSDTDDLYALGARRRGSGSSKPSTARGLYLPVDTHWPWTSAPVQGVYAVANQPHVRHVLSLTPSEPRRPCIAGESLIRPYRRVDRRWVTLAFAGAWIGGRDEPRHNTSVHENAKPLSCTSTAH